MTNPTERDQRLAEIRARVEASTKEPMVASEYLDDGRVGIICHDNRIVASLLSKLSWEDATFFAHANVDIPWLLSELDAALEREKVLQKNLDQVDEVLAVNWVGLDGDYRKALHDLITSSIAIENDPRVSSTAKARQDELNELREREKRLRVALEEAANVIGSGECSVNQCPYSRWR